MDPYNFMNAKDIAEHCRRIKHQFTPLEAAFIIYLNMQKTISEKHGAWNEIIATMADMEVPGCPNTPYYDSLHSFLRDYMALENRILDRFSADEPKAAYRYDTYDVEDHGMSCKDGRLFSTLEAVLGAVKGEDERDVKRCRIEKQWIDGSGECISVFTTLEGEFLSVRDDGPLTEAERALRMAFDGMWFAIPTPFQKGDILQVPNGEAFALESICYWDVNEKQLNDMRKHADLSDMTAWGYWLDAEGRVYYECMHAYQDLEYYKGELQGKNRILRAINSHLKGSIDLTLLLNAYDLIRREEHIKSHKKCLGYTDEGLLAAGLLEGGRGNCVITPAIKYRKRHCVERKQKHDHYDVANSV